MKRPGWGAGVASAGAAGPSQVFLAITMAGVAIVAGILFWDRRFAAGGMASLAAVYFALRLFAGLGIRRER